MAHEISESDRVLHAIGTDMPWHKLSSEVDPNITLCENAIQNGMNWEVHKHQMYREINRGGLNQFIEVDNQFALVRSDLGVVLGTATGDYEPYMNMTGFAALDELIARSEGALKLNVMGTIRRGAIVWGLLEVSIEDEEVTAGDKIKRYFLFSFGHTGKIGISAGWTDIRVVCSNTIHAAWSSSASKLIRITHRGGVEANVDMVMNTIDVAARDFKATISDYKKMLNTQINQSDIRKYVKTVLELEEKDTNKRATNMIDKITGLSAYGKGNLGIQETVWAAFNGITEFLSHQAGRNADNRYASLWWGQNRNVLKKAHSEAMKLAA